MAGIKFKNIKATGLFLLALILFSLNTKAQQDIESKEDKPGEVPSNLDYYFYGRKPSPVVIPYETDEQFDNRMKWWKDAKYGMFIHWGLYSLLAGEYKGQMTPKLAEWIQNTLHIPLAEYEKLVKQFNPTKFNADDWAKLAKNAGMKYVVLVSKHHDGFAMFDSKVSDYDIMSTPYKKDILKQLKDACNKQGLKFGVYYSHNIDWEHPQNKVGNANNGLGVSNLSWNNLTDFKPDEMDKEIYLKEKAYPQIKELLTNYGVMDILWFDMGTGLSNDQVRTFVKEARELQPNIIISSRIGAEADQHYLNRNMLFDFYTPNDNFFSGNMLAMPWEMAGTTNTSWGFRKNDNHWRTPKFILTSLLASISRGGNYLLNIGPKADGSLVEQPVQNLLAVGNWLQKNGEAVYNTKPSPFPWNYSWGFVTQKPNKLFLNVLNYPQNDKIELNGLLTKVIKAYNLSTKQTIPFSQKGRFVSLDIKNISNKDSLATTIVLDCDGEVVVNTSISQDQNNCIQLDRITGDYDALHKMTSWKFNITTPGTFKVQMMSNEKGAHEKPEWVGAEQKGAIEIAGQIIPVELKRDAEAPNTSLFFYKEITSDVGVVYIKQPGSYTLQLKDFVIDPKKYGKGLFLNKIELTPQ